MADKSKIEWTDATWNPVAGCALVSPGCTNCYAMHVAARLELMGQAAYAGLTKPSKAGPVWTGKVTLVESALAKPLSWRRPRRVFVNSMSDLFHESVPDAYIDKVFAVMALAKQHTFQVLTKRADRMQRYMKELAYQRLDAALDDLPLGTRAPEEPFGCTTLPLPNVWLGVSVEDQTRADERIPLLLDTPAAVRWISAEPLLGPVDLASIKLDMGDGLFGDALNWHHRPYHDERRYAGLDWVVVGGESGPGARPMHPDWARFLRDQCAGAGVPFFFKQWGEHWPAEKTRVGKDGEVWRATARGGEEWFFDEVGKADAQQVRMTRVGKHAAGRALDGRTHDEFPQVRE